MTDVWIVTSRTGDLEVFSGEPRFDWAAEDRRCYVAGIDGGDALEIFPRSCETAGHDPGCAFVVARADLFAQVAASPLDPVLLGAAREYLDGGDQEELCSCGADIVADGEHGPVCAAGHDGSDGSEDEQERAYEIASADVVLALTACEATTIADALGLLARMDESAHGAELLRLEQRIRTTSRNQPYTRA